MTSITDTILQRQNEAVKLLIGYAMYNPDMVLRDAGWLSPATIKNDNMRLLWETILDLKDPIKAAIKCDMLNEANVWMSETPQYGSLYGNDYAKKITQEARMYSIGAQLSDLARFLTTGEYEQIDRIIEKMGTRQVNQSEKMPDIAEAGIQFMDALNGDNMSIPVGIPRIDDAIGGIWRKYLTVICARPSVGKTAIALQIARNISRSKKVHFFSLEMAAQSLWGRMACGLCEISYRDVVAKRINNEEDKMRLIEATSELMKLYAGKFFVLDTRCTTDTIWQKVSQDKPDIIIVDHLRLLADTHGDNENKRQGYTSWRLKEIAKEFNCAVLCLAQLNRGIESRSEKAPTLSDLRDSGEIEENADVVVGMHNPDKTDFSGKQQRTIKVDLNVMKFRDGPSNIGIHLNFDHTTQWFEGVRP